VSNRVCAVVVTYNRKNLLLECLEALRKQTRPLEGMVIVDNASTDGTPKALLDSGYIRELPPTGISESWEYEHEIRNFHDGSTLKVHYVRMSQNTGGAGGFHEGMKRAYEKGYDWIWVMDDDVKPDDACLGKMLSYQGKASVIVPVRLSLVGELEEGAALEYDLSRFFIRHPRRLGVKQAYICWQNLPEMLEVKDFSFEGPFFHRNVIKKVGFPRPDFFILEDDTEYALRITLISKSRIILLKEAKMYRMLPPRLDFEYWRLYYCLRNMAYIHRLYGKTVFVRLKPWFWYLGSIVKRILKLRPDWTRYKVTICALFDAYFLKEPLPLRYLPGSIEQKRAVSQ